MNRLIVLLKVIIAKICVINPWRHCLTWKCPPRQVTCLTVILRGRFRQINPWSRPLTRMCWRPHTNILIVLCSRVILKLRFQKSGCSSSHQADSKSPETVVHRTSDKDLIKSMPRKCNDFPENSRSLDRFQEKQQVARTPKVEGIIIVTRI